MPKAEAKSKRVRVARKSTPRPTALTLPTPFRLNREGKEALALHHRHEAAHRAAKAALEADRPGRLSEEYMPSAETLALRDAWHALGGEITAHMDALAERIGARKRRTAADAVTLFIAGLHSRKARHPLTEALDSALGLGLLRLRSAPRPSAPGNKLGGAGRCPAPSVVSQFECEAVSCGDVTHVAWAEAREEQKWQRQSCRNSC